MDQPRSQRMLARLVIVLGLLGLVVILLNWRDIRQVLAEANWKLLPVALLFTGLSYACMSFAYAVANRLFRIQMRMVELAEVGFVSQALNQLLTSAGAAGYSVRFLVMGRQGVSAQDILAASFFYFYCSSLGMWALLPASLAYVSFGRPVSSGFVRVVGLGTFLLLTIFLLGTLTMFVRPLRVALLRFMARAGRAVTRRDVQPQLAEFEATIARGMAESRRRPLQLLLLLFLVAADWAFRLLVLAFCFQALGASVPVGVLVTGYALGVVAGVLSMIPGGLGVQEGSMAGVYALLGVPFEQAVLVSLLFRAVYYFVPYLISLAYYRRMLRT